MPFHFPSRRRLESHLAAVLDNGLSHDVRTLFIGAERWFGFHCAGHWRDQLVNQANVDRAKCCGTPCLYVPSPAPN
jgi:hypothetical protein